MNKDNVAIMRAVFTKMPQKCCNMREWFSEGAILPEGAPLRAHWRCGTVGCIGGWAAAYMQFHGIDGSASDWLGLTHDERYELFYTFPTVDEDFDWKSWILKRLDDILEMGRVRTVEEVFSE